MKTFLLALIGLVVLIAALGGAKATQIMALIKGGEAMIMPPSVISTVPVQKQQWEQTLASIGSLEAVQGVTVTADIPGRITNIDFKSGGDVTAGDVLIQQDITSEQAQLRAAEASVTLAKVNLERVTKLLKKRVSSAAEFDAAEALHKEAVARADTIRTNIEKKTVKAPFSGRLGIRLVDLGQDLAQGKPIVSLQAVDPILVNFHLPQKDLSKLELGLTVRVSSDAVPDQVFTGKITAISPEVDPSTRNVKVQASLTNPKEQLLPGMFANIAVVLPEIKQVLAVPVTAVAYATYGDSLFTVLEKTDEKTGKTQLVAQQQFIRLGKARGDFVSVEKGIEADATVISAGVFKLHNGSSVQVNNENQPKYDLNPDPEDT